MSRWHHGYRHPQGDFDPEEPLADWDEEEEHPINCICPECQYWEWLLFQGEDRQDPLADENYVPPF